MKDKTLTLISRNLDINKQKIKKGIERDIIKEHETHFRFDKRFAGITRGTCVFKNELTVHGFPKIRRALTLSPTIEKRFGDSVAVEEKMNGYNVRIVKINQKIFGLTRSGLICPYTTQKAKEKLDMSFFQENPDYLICGEMVGPDNPYIPTEIYEVDSIDFFVFDIREKDSNKQLPVKKRRNILEKFDINNVHSFGILDTQKAHQKIKDIIKKLGEEKKEGVVIKDPMTDLEPIKYTSSQSNCSDLQYAYKFYHDYGSDFVNSRTVREGFQSYEWEENDLEREQRAKRIGLSILEPMIETIKNKKEGKNITETVKIKVSDLKIAKNFLDHLESVGIDSEATKINELKDGNYRVFIEKLQESTNDKTNSLLNGGLW